MADYLIQNGHHKIMYLTDADDPISALRLQGVRNAYKKNKTSLIGLSHQLLPATTEDRR